MGCAFRPDWTSASTDSSVLQVHAHFDESLTQMFFFPHEQGAGEICFNGLWLQPHLSTPNECPSALGPY